jgi:dihydroorotate dehydrogenase (fumarate)
MPDFSVSYLGIPLQNPLVAASSKLTATLDGVKQCEDAGAGAVVLKSLFEEQIVSDAGSMLGNLDSSVHAEAHDYAAVMSEEYALDSYLKLVEDAKAQLDIPVIASLNCVSAGKWLDYAANFQTVGADALELNVFVIPAEAKRTGADHEKIYIDIAREITKRVGLPVSMKIGPHFSGLAHIMHTLQDEGMKGLVLFNRFYRPDIDIEAMKLVPAKIFSVPQEMSLILQWVALMSGELDCDLSATTGVTDSNAVVKQLLAGAKTVQLCSTLFQNGVGYIKTIRKGLGSWMERHGYAHVEEFRGMLCQEKSDNPEAYERSQYIKALVGIM